MRISISHFSAKTIEFNCQIYSFKHAIESSFELRKHELKGAVKWTFELGSLRISVRCVECHIYCIIQVVNFIWFIWVSSIREHRAPSKSCRRHREEFRTTDFYSVHVYRSSHSFANSIPRFYSCWWVVVAGKGVDFDSDESVSKILQ